MGKPPLSLPGIGSQDKLPYRNMSQGQADIWLLRMRKRDRLAISPGVSLLSQQMRMQDRVYENHHTYNSR